MRMLLAALTLSLLLTGCITRMDIEQGNILPEDLVHKIHPGMSEEQVKNVLGNPVLVNTFNNNRLDYVYTYRPGHAEMTEKYMTLTFRNHRLTKIDGNLYSTFMK